MNYGYTNIGDGRRLRWEIEHTPVPEGRIKQNATVASRRVWLEEGGTARELTRDEWEDLRDELEARR